MASTFIAAGEESKEKAPSPRAMRRSFSSNSSACGHGAAGAAAPKCVCAPATHAGSFKCRLHRVSSQGHHSAPATPMTQPPAVSSASTRTVEAQ